MPNPLDLPVHPALVHFPLALLTLAWVCVLLQHGRAAEPWAERARLLETAGVVTLPFVVIAGVIDLRGVGQLTSPAWDLPLIWHVLASVMASLLFTGHLFWRRNREVSEGGARVADVVAPTVAVWGLLLAGALAAELVYGG